MLDSIAGARFPASSFRWTRILTGCGGLLILVSAGEILLRSAEPHRVNLPSYTWLPEVDRPIAYVLIAVWASSAVALLFNVQRRAAAGTLALTVAASMALENQAYSNHLVLLAVLACLIAFTPTDGASIPYWSAFLFRTQLSSVYLWTAIAKLNSSYLSGAPIEAGTRRPLVDAVPEGTFQVISAAILVVELLLAFGLWHRKLRQFVLPLGVVMHVGIMVLGVPAKHLFPFGLLVLSVYPLFAADPTSDEEQGELPARDLVTVATSP